MLSRLRAAAVPATALALVVTTLAAPPAAADVPYLEPTVTVAEGRSSQPEPLSLFAATEDRVAAHLRLSGTRILSGSGMSQLTPLPDGVEVVYDNGGFVGDRIVALRDDGVDVVGAAGVVHLEATGTVDYSAHATGWLEVGAPGDARALVLARLDGSTATRTTLTQLPDTSGVMSTHVSPSGNRVIVRAGAWDAPVYLDIDVVAGTATPITGAVAAVAAVADDAYVLRMSNGTRERRGTNPAQWTGTYEEVVLWDGRTIEHRLSNGVHSFAEIAADGSTSPVPSTPVLEELTRFSTVQVSPTLAWSSDYASGTLRRITPSGVTLVRTMPAAPLTFRATDVTDGTVRWIDDSTAEEYAMGDLWARDLDGGTGRSLVLSRATGRSLAVADGRTYVARWNGGLTKYEVVRATGDQDAQVLAEREEAGRFSAAPGRVGVSGYPEGLLVDTATGTTSTLPRSFQLVAGRWNVSHDWSTSKLTATAGSTTRELDVPSLSSVHAVGTRLVVSSYTSALSEPVILLLDLEDPSGTLRTLPRATADQVVAAGGPGYVVHEAASGDLVVRALEDGTELYRMDTAGHDDPAAALDDEWVVWSVDGPDGPRLVAAPLPGDTPTPTPSFGDVPATHPFRSEIGWLVGQGITEGYADGTFRPTAAVSRQAMAAFLYRASGSPTFSAPTTASFSDVPTTHPFFKEIEWLADSGVAGGYADGTFKPTAAVSRQAMAAFLHRHAGEPAPGAGAPTFPDVPTGHQFRTPISWLAGTQITTGYADGSFQPTAAVSRQAMAAFLYRYDQLPD